MQTADMPTDFWSGWIAVLTIVSFAGLVWLIFSVYFEKDAEGQETDAPVWDENLRKDANPAPMWWFWWTLALLVFSVIYLMLYPGLGSYSGALKWSQGGRLNESFSQFEAEFGGIRKLIAEAQLETLQADTALMNSAQRVFDRNCAVCHGYDGAGQAAHFPDLTDAEWQWGGTQAQIEQSIRGGRNAVMIGWSQILGDEGVRNVVSYMKQLGMDGADGHPGQAQYNQFCFACHGLDGSGNPVLGAPSLVDDIWLYGDGDEALLHSIAIGRSGEMPAFGERLDDTQIRLLVALLTRDSDTSRFTPPPLRAPREDVMTQGRLKSPPERTRIPRMRRRTSTVSRGSYAANSSRVTNDPVEVARRRSNSARLRRVVGRSASTVTGSSSVAMGRMRSAPSGNSRACPGSRCTWALAGRYPTT